MKFTVMKNELNDALKVVSRAAAIKANVPVVTGILIKAAISTVTLQATDYNISISEKILGNIETDGQVVIDTKKLVEICAKLDGEKITLEFTPENAQVQITSGNAKFSLLTMNADDFPEIKTPETATNFSLPVRTLKKIVERTNFAAAIGDDRPMFTGIYIERKAEEIVAAATNTHRLAIAKEKIEWQDGEEVNFILPAKSLSTITKFFDDDQKVAVDVGEKFVAFTCGNIFVTLRKIAGNFPPYEKVIPTETTTTATVDLQPFRKAVDRINVISKNRDPKRIDFEFNPKEVFGMITISAAADVGKAEETIAGTVEGQDLKISFVPDYITDVLKIAESEKLIIKMTESLKPIDVREVDNDNFIYVVTPVRTR